MSLTTSLTDATITDPLDDNNFDVISFINSRFPTENSLNELDTYVIGIGSQISVLVDEISKAVQTQSIAGQQASKDLLEAQTSIQDLFTKINDIKLKASQSEKMVQEICADIKKLDYAKTHLQTSITSLKRLQMLITAVGQLELLAQEYQYRETANLLDAVKQLLAHFDKYNLIPLISDIRTRVDVIQIDLKKHVHYAFREIGQLVDTVSDLNSAVYSELPGNMKSLSDACLVVDALGILARKELLDEFVQLQLVPYEKLFGPDKQHFTLDQVERRWAWFKRLLKNVDSKFSNICPAHWKLPLKLCLEFSERTKSHLILLLTAMESKDQTDVHSLLKALQSTLRFEQEMNSRFSNDLKQSLPSTNNLTVTTTLSINSNVSSSTNKHSSLESLKANDVLTYIPTDHSTKNIGDDDVLFLNNANNMINGGISNIYDKFLGSYVLLERQNLEELLQRLGQEEDTTKGDNDGADQLTSGSISSGNVYGSAMSMFVFIKNSIKRCTALTTGQTFLALTKEFKTCMQQYTKMLRSRCPPSVGQPPVYKLSPGIEVSLCYLVNTGEYCSEVVPQLEQMIKQKISSQLSNKIDLSSEVDAFTDLVAYSLKVLVSGILDKLDPAFRIMSNSNFGTTTQVGEESSYVHMFNGSIAELVPKIRESLASSYYNSFCTKIATELLTKYLDVIMKHKRISEMGSQQLLLDTYSLKTLLMHLHNIGIDTNSTKINIPPMYIKLITAKAGHIEMILKLLGTPEELLVDRFKSMWIDGSSNDLQNLMDKKGMNRQQQQISLNSLATNLASNVRNVANTLNLQDITKTAEQIGSLYNRK